MIGGRDGQNTYNNIKSKVATLEPNGSTATRTENLNAEETENNDLKIIL